MAGQAHSENDRPLQINKAAIAASQICHTARDLKNND
jgi:hypothetical protein